MSALVDFYETRYEDWYQRYTDTPWWRPFERLKAKREYEYYLKLMLDTAQIEKMEYDRYLKS
ncbi:MAG TPA: hypothetical protein VGE97_03670 [Nitrososphaera sp.]|jgi:hypothetical protein